MSTETVANETKVELPIPAIASESGETKSLKMAAIIYGVGPNNTYFFSQAAENYESGIAHLKSMGFLPDMKDPDVNEYCGKRQTFGVWVGKPEDAPIETSKLFDNMPPQTMKEDDWNSLRLKLFTQIYDSGINSLVVEEIPYGVAIFPADTD